MQLIKLSSDHDSFHTVPFHNGVNIIIGKKSNPLAKNDGNTFNGVGKSLIVHLLHFCLCSNKIPALESALPDWLFTLQFSASGSTHTISRNTSKQNIIIYDEIEYSLTEARSKLISHVLNSSDLCSVLSFQALLYKFIRRYRSSYIRYYDSHGKHSDDYQNLLYNGALLGLNTELIINKKKLKEEQDALKKTEKAFKMDPIFKQYYLGRDDAQMDADDLEYSISKLEQALDSFKVSSIYHEIEEQANSISHRKKELENQIAILENNEANINAALQIHTDFSIKYVEKMYETASIEIPQMIKKSLAEVEAFHLKLLKTRNLRLSEELRKNKASLNLKKQEVAKIGAEMDRLFSYLSSHGALEEYAALNRQLSDFQLQLSHIREYQNLLKSFQAKISEIKEQMIFENRDTDTYLNEVEPFIQELRHNYSKMTRLFYPKKKSVLLITNNIGDNKQRFNIDARIEDDSSDGVNEVKVFCFDMLLLMQQVSNFQFVFHDSRLFANMDPRQRATLYRIAYDVCHEYGFQYISSINDDALESIRNSMDDEEYQTILRDNIILTLKDDSPDSKLLGIQVDMDLES